MTPKELREQADQLFGKRATLTSFWQEVGENFYPERADFTLKRVIGTNITSNLQTSYPILCRRDLGDQIGVMLRPTAKPWFHMAPIDDRRQNNDAQRWLQWAEGTMRRAMYDPKTMFTRATKQGDHDFAAFGQAVISIELNTHGNALLYRTWHLRDTVWQENQDGKIGAVFRKWKPTARDLCRLFPGRVDQKVEALAKREPFTEVECLHMMVESDLWDGTTKMPWVSIYYDSTNDKVMEQTPQHNKKYVIPRWQTVSGSQYAYSPATVAGLPDGRLLQAMTYTLLEAGEKAVNPPMVATQDAVKSDVNIRAGGLTWVDYEYDERLGEAVRPINQDLRGLPFSTDLIRDTRTMLSQAFYLNKLNLPQRAAEMTAYEVGQRIQEYIRGAMPIFEPMEMDYNGALCEETFELLMRNGAFGSPYEMPPSLRGADIQFRFESPLHDAIEAAKGQKFLEMKQYIAEAVTMDQGAAALPDALEALRDVLNGVGVPAKWVRPEVSVHQILDQQKAAAAAQQTLAAMQQAAGVIKDGGAGMESMANAQVAGNPRQAVAAPI